MALSFYQNSTHYFILQTIMSAEHTDYMVVAHDKGFTTTMVNRNPERPTNPASEDWFMKHYQKHYREFEKDKNCKLSQMLRAGVEREKMVAKAAAKQVEEDLAIEDMVDLAGDLGGYLNTKGREIND